MNDFNNFYEEPRRLNIKKVVIISAILIIIVISLIILIARKISSPKQISETLPNITTSIFYSHENLVSLELSNTFNLKQYQPKQNYLIELRSDNNLAIFVSKENIMPNKSLSEIVNADKSAYLSNFANYSNLSDIKELTIGENLAYTYSLHYLDKKLNQAFYLQVAWLQIGDIYYIFDIEFPLDDLSFNTNIVSNVLTNFKKL